MRRFIMLRYAIFAIPVLALLLLGIPLFMRIAVARYIYDAPENVPSTEAALVLGASIVRGKPSPILEERAKMAFAFYRAGKVEKILVTGDNSALTHDEVTPVRKYLIDAGVEAEDIFLDHAGFDTYSSMYRARHIFLADSIIVVTQDFHLPRALFVARRLGMSAYGISAASSSEGRNYIREIPASTKALIDLLMSREPKYLGDTIPLDGDGSITWY